MPRQGSDRILAQSDDTSLRPQSSKRALRITVGASTLLIDQAMRPVGFQLRAVSDIDLELRASHPVGSIKKARAIVTRRARQYSRASGCEIACGDQDARHSARTELEAQSSGSAGILHDRDEIESRPVRRCRRLAQDPPEGDWQNDRAGRLRPAAPALCTGSGLPARRSAEPKRQVCRPVARSPMPLPRLVAQIATARLDATPIENATGKIVESPENCPSLSEVPPANADERES